MTKAKDARTTRQSLLMQAERAIIAPDALAGLQRRAADLGFIIHAREPAHGKDERRKQKRPRPK